MPARYQVALGSASRIRQPPIDMSESTIDYEATAWGDRHHYSLGDGELVYRFGKSDMSISIALRPGGFSLRQRWQTHRQFRAGLFLIAFPLVTLGVIFAKEQSLAGLGAMLYIQLAILTVGLVLVARFHRIYRAHYLRTVGGDEILIIRDPANAERADAFLSRLNAMT